LGRACREYFRFPIENRIRGMYHVGTQLW
jgi:hypothetical protein